MTNQAQRTLQYDNERVCVTLWKFLPGATTGFHRHEMDYVIVPLTTGNLRIVVPVGVETEVSLTAGISYFRKAGVEHDVVNINNFEFAFLELELK